MNNIIRDIERHGFDVQEIAPLTFDICKDGTAVLSSVLIDDLELYLEMMDDKKDFTFDVLSINQCSAPMIETDFYKWMRDNEKTSFHRIYDIREYLANAFGFKAGVNRVDSVALRILKIIGGHYFDKEIKPLYINVNGFFFNSIGDLICTPVRYGMSTLVATRDQLTKEGDHIKASRIQHLINIY